MGDRLGFISLFGKSKISRILSRVEGRNNEKQRVYAPTNRDCGRGEGESC